MFYIAVGIIWGLLLLSMAVIAATQDDRGWNKGCAEKNLEMRMYGHILVDWKDSFVTDFGEYRQKLPKQVAALIWVVAFLLMTIIAALISDSHFRMVCIGTFSMIGWLCYLGWLPTYLDMIKSKNKWDYLEAKGMWYFTANETGEQFRIKHYNAKGEYNYDKLPWQSRKNDEYKADAQAKKEREEFDKKKILTAISCLAILFAALVPGTINQDWLALSMECAMIAIASIMGGFLPTYKAFRIWEDARETRHFLPGCRVEGRAPSYRQTKTIEQQKTYGAARFATDDEAIRGLGA